MAINRFEKVSLSILICVATCVVDCDAQTNDFKDFLSGCIPNKTIVKKNDSVESETTFLGCIRDEKWRIEYYVIKEFYAVPAARVRHGHSRIIFLRGNKNLAATYDLDSPDELPYELSQNCLYFKYKRGGKEQIQRVKIRDSLPAPICVMPDGCYWPIKFKS
jgi:hypothetical protein